MPSSGRLVSVQGMGAKNYLDCYRDAKMKPHHGQKKLFQQMKQLRCRLLPMVVLGVMEHFDHRTCSKM